MIKKPFKPIIVFLLFIITSCEWHNNNANEIKNIIIFIGDGMGLAQLYAGMSVADHVFHLEEFPYSGFSKTNSADNYITDSAAGGTAIACGIKTKNGMIGLSRDSSSVNSIMEIAHKNGLATGVVSTSAVTHATPASFVAHNINRDNYEEIARDYLKGTLDLFLGGGEDHFRYRKDGTDLTVDLVAQGFKVVYTLDELKNSRSVKIAGLLAKLHMPKVTDGRKGALVEMTRKSIETLNKNRNGFVLMVEGAMIDFGGHEQNLEYLVSEVIDLDDAIGVAKEFAKKNGNTLIVVTADHETGGLSLTGGSLPSHQVTGNFAGGSHTAVMVPVFSYGPGAEIFSGIHDNTFFFNEFLKLLNIRN